MQHLVISVLSLLLCIQTIQFFTLQSANKDKPLADYLSMHAIYFIKANLESYKENPVTLLVSPLNFEKLNNLHHEEQYEFFFPGIDLDFEKAYDLKNNEIKIKTLKSYGKTYTYVCGERGFYCPIGYAGKIVLHY